MTSNCPTFYYSLHVSSVYHSILSRLLLNHVTLSQNILKISTKHVPWSLWKWGQCFVILLPCEFSLFHKKLCSSLNLWWSDTISLNKWLRNPLHVELRLHTLRAPSHWDTFHTNLVCFSSFVNCKTWYKQKHTTFD